MSFRDVEEVLAQRGITGDPEIRPLVAKYDLRVEWLPQPRIPGARFVSLESGGHLMLGQQKEGRDELARFFAERK